MISLPVRRPALRTLDKHSGPCFVQLVYWYCVCTKALMRQEKETTKTQQRPSRSEREHQPSVVISTAPAWFRRTRLPAPAHRGEITRPQGSPWCCYCYFWSCFRSRQWTRREIQPTAGPSFHERTIKGSRSICNIPNTVGTVIRKTAATGTGSAGSWRKKYKFSSSGRNCQKKTRGGDWSVSKNN